MIKKHINNQLNNLKMEDKDRMLLDEVTKVAKHIFDNYVTLNIEGTYTAAELYNEKNSMGERIVIEYNGHDYDTHEVSIGEGSGYSFTTDQVFRVMYCLEKLCGVRGDKKTRFTYRVAEKKIIKEKAMYYTGSMERGCYNHETGCREVTGEGNYKVVTRKIALKKISDRLAEDKNGRPFYKSGDTWYLFNNSELPEQVIERLKNEPDFLFGLLSKFDFSYKCELNTIFKALFEALKLELVNNTPEEIKRENEPKNIVICKVVTGMANDGDLCVEQRRLKSIGNSLYKDDDNLYFGHGDLCYCLGGYTHGVATFLKEQGSNIQSKILEMIEQGEISMGSAKILYENMRKDDAPGNVGSMKETYDDYPTCSYNESNAGDLERPIFDNAGKSANSWGNGCHALPDYSMRKVLPSELFNARRKISLFNPMFLLCITNCYSP